ncbi:MAG: SCO family protein [Chromatiaceae bacterium]|nr:MAG: SCO family protein [Chromatiaceae bacterium]
MPLDRRLTQALPLILIALLAAVLLWLVFIWDPAPPTPGSHAALGLTGTPAGGEFRLHGPDGPVSLTDLRGQVVLLYFGYATCPDVCPTNLALIALALRSLEPAEAAAVQPVFVSVDPERDTPARLAAFTSAFHPRILGLTGSPAEIAAAAAAYGAAYQRTEQPGSALGYVIDHSAYTYLIDPTGRLVATLDHATPAEQIRTQLRELLPSLPAD